MRTFTINLKSATKRKDYHSLHLESRGVKTTFINAVDGSALSDQEYDLLKDTSVRPLTRGEVGCFLSHKLLWEKCLSLGEPILILEDDVILSEKFTAIADEAFLEKMAERINLEAAGITKKKTFSKIRHDRPNYSLTELYRERNGSGAYILWPKGARKLLKFYAAKADLADICLKQYFLKTYQLEPAIAVQGQHCPEYRIKTAVPITPLAESTIDSKYVYKGAFKFMIFKTRRGKQELKHLLRKITKRNSERRTVICHPLDF